MTCFRSDRYYRRLRIDCCSPRQTASARARCSSSISPRMSIRAGHLAAKLSINASSHRTDDVEERSFMFEAQFGTRTRGHACNQIRIQKSARVLIARPVSVASECFDDIKVPANAFATARRRSQHTGVRVRSACVIEHAGARSSPPRTDDREADRSRATRRAASVAARHSTSPTPTLHSLKT